VSAVSAAAGPVFPGATAVSALRVYDWETPDGLHGGTPHMHTVSSEAYVVTAGAGEAHTLSADGFAVDELAPGSVLWFSPGTVHRLVNTGGLEILTIMQNAGLPEAGDAVLTFPTSVLADAAAYAAAATLPRVDEASAGLRQAAARARRDLALLGYGELRSAVVAHGPGALLEFQRLAAQLVHPRVADWTALWSESVLAETERTRSQLAALAAGDGAHLAAGSVVRGVPHAGPRLLGMCGHLQTWHPESRESA
jgi:mannose-6-phosphate isomerase-like protein (cupin superfamily)